MMLTRLRERVHGIERRVKIQIVGHINATERIDGVEHLLAQRLMDHPIKIEARRTRASGRSRFNGIRGLNLGRHGGKALEIVE